MTPVIVKFLVTGMLGRKPMRAELSPSDRKDRVISMNHYGRGSW